MVKITPIYGKPKPINLSSPENNSAGINPNANPARGVNFFFIFVFIGNKHEYSYDQQNDDENSDINLCRRHTIGSHDYSVQIPDLFYFRGEFTLTNFDRPDPA